MCLAALLQHSWWQRPRQSRRVLPRAYSGSSGMPVTHTFGQTKSELECHKAYGECGRETALAGPRHRITGCATVS